MGNFLTWSFWFSARPGVFSALSFKVILGFIIFSSVLSVISGVIKKRLPAKSLYVQFWKSLISFFSINAIIGLLLAFFNYEMAPFLSSRFWFLLWVAGMAVWMFFIFKAVVKIPNERARNEKEKEFRKYIP